MAYITPDTELQFFQNLNIDPDYENTIYFPTTQAKDAYFDALPSIKCPSCYYQRELRGFCRVEVPLSQMLGRTYMRFKNKLFEGKWFYAFINDVEYVNNITTQVNYTLDYMMTWMGSYTLDQCFVERNHTATDAIGANIVPESLAVNNMIENTHFSTDPNNSQSAPQGTGTMGSATVAWQYVIVMTPDANDPPAGDSNGIYSGLYYHYENDAAGVSTYINSLSGQAQERIQGIFYIPKFYKGTTNGLLKNTTVHLQKPKAGYTKIDGYTPKNNKLFTFPYNYIQVDNMEGSKAEYAFELFKTVTADFYLTGIVGEQTQITCTPLAYKVDSAIITWIQFKDQLSMKEFPMCAWTVDTFKAYLSQQLVSIPMELGAGILATTVSGGALAPVLVGTAGNVINSVTNLMMKSQHPNEARGANVPLIPCAGYIPYKDFRFSRISVRSDEAKRIDDYFTMFGYAINEVKQPSINVRPYYTYVKTIGCHINGSFPAADQRVIEEVFNKGVRFWNQDHTHIGDYSVNNAPT